MDDLGIVLHCLRFECSDFSSFNQDATQNDLLGVLIDTLCNEVDFQATATQLSGYKETLPNVVELAWFDLDVLQIEMLASVGEFDLAYDRYDIVETVQRNKIH